MFLENTLREAYSAVNPYCTGPFPFFLLSSPVLPDRTRREISENSLYGFPKEAVCVSVVGYGTAGGMMERLMVLGTGNASVTRCYNTCFALHDGEHAILVDAGGGNGIIHRLNQMGLDLASIRHAFVSHQHTDHLLGMIWIIRQIATLMLADQYEGYFCIHAGGGLTQTIRTISQLTLAPVMADLVDRRILLQEVEDGEKRRLGTYQFTFFDIGSSLTHQFGFTARLHNGRSLVFLGDEPLLNAGRRHAKDCDWLLSEAYCLYAQRAIFKPHEKFHSTVREACEAAAELNVCNLVLWHTEDTQLADRKRLYTEEGRQFFHGNLFVPDDLEEIIL